MPLPIRLPARIVPVVLACFAVAVTTLVRYLLAPYLGPKAPLLLFTLPVLFCALFGGVASALIATALSSLSSAYFFTGEAGTFYVEDPADHLQHALFAVVALATTALGAKLEKSRAALRDSEERFRLLVQGTQDVAVFFISPRGIIESWNEGAQRIKGYASDEILGQNVAIFYTEEDQHSGVPARLLAEATELGSVRVEAWRVRKNGERFWADVVLTAAHDANGRLRGFSKITYDRTREHALLKSLEESEQTAKALLESTAQAVIGINHSGAIRLVNKTAEEMFGYSRNEIVGQPLEILLPEKLSERHAGQRADYFSHPRPRPMGQGLELAARRKDGTIFPIEASINMCETPAGRMAVSFVSDITKRKKMENELLLERSQLKSILEYSPLQVSIRDLSGQIILANQSLADAMGVPPEQLIGKGVFDLLPPDVAKRMWQRDQQAMRARGPVRDEEQIRLKDGSVRTFATVRFPVSYINSLEPFGLCTFSLDISEQKEAEERALHAAQHDPLTDLPNRALMYEFGSRMLASARRSGTKLAVLFFDLDRFKPINDTYGHETGDKMLQEVARRLTQGVRTSDLVGRIGGDEFVAVLPGMTTDHDVQQAAQNLLVELRAPYHIEGLELRTSPSIGISLYPNDGADIDTLIRHADAAMYHAKANGRNTYQFFNLDIDMGSKRAFALEQRLRQSFNESEFEVHYQPIVDTRTGQALGAEALIRWRPKDENMVMPGEFIAAAEACGLINQLGAWVLLEACRQQVRWTKSGLPQLRVAVNVSPIQFRAHDFDQRVAEAIERSGILPAYVELEVTESMVMHEIERTTETLLELKRQGLRISLDDFGTGYSSLSHLSVLPIDKLKVDQSFVRNLLTDKRSLVITETVIGLCKRLGVEVVAEGIESNAALDWLRERDCDLGQGYLFGAPMDAREFEQWFRRTQEQAVHH